MTNGEVKALLTKHLGTFHDNNQFRSNTGGSMWNGQRMNCWYRVAYSPVERRPLNRGRVDPYFVGAQRVVPGQECVVVLFEYEHRNARYDGRKLISPGGSTTPTVGECEYYSGKTTRIPSQQISGLVWGMIASALAFFVCRDVDRRWPSKKQQSEVPAGFTAPVATSKLPSKSK
jgi:hypothetical protein